MDEAPILEADLHLYVDDTCDPALRARVQAYLDRNPEAAERVANWSAQNNALKHIFAMPPSRQAGNTSTTAAKKLKSSHMLQKLTLTLAFLLGVSLTIAVFGGLSIVKTDANSVKTWFHSIFLRG